VKKFLLLALFVSSSAFAQSQNFEGFGIALDYSLNSITDKTSPDASQSNTSRSGVPSITADFNKALSGNVLIGAYGTYDLGTTDTSNTDPDATHPIEAGAKLGYAFTDSLLAYVKLGYSWSKFSSPGYYQWLNGPSYGVGAEYLLTKSIFTRLEVSQQNYKSVGWNDGSSDKIWINSGTISIGYRF
jgi:opacity protein-like surface antigen